MPTYDVNAEDHDALLDIVRALGLTPENMTAGSVTVDIPSRLITADEIVRDDRGQPMLDAQGEEIKTVRRTYQINHRARLITEEQP